MHNILSPLLFNITLNNAMQWPFVGIKLALNIQMFLGACPPV